MVSIVVPVYNVELYLRECLDSLCGQTYRDIEIILVDDGSGDGSGKICDEYAQADARIQVIHKQNEGVSAARNEGIRQAGGEYLIFVDADDYIHRELVEIYMTEPRKDEVIICEYSSVPSLFKTSYLDVRSIEETDISQFMELYIRGYINSTFNKLYQTDILKKEGIFFRPEMSLGEDLLFNLDYLRHKKSMWRIIHCPLYYYRENRLGSLSSFNRKDLFEVQQVCSEAVRDFLEDMELWNEENQCAYYGLYWERLFLTARMGWEYERGHCGKGNLEEILNSSLWESVWAECKKRKLLTLKRRVKCIYLRLLYRYMMLRRIWKNV